MSKRDIHYDVLGLPEYQ